MNAVLPEYDAWLARGPVVHVRRARADDRAALRTLHERLSVRSLHSRYFTAAPDVEKNLERLLRPTDDEHDTVVGTIDGGIVAVGCYEQLPTSGTAEIAFLVDDDHHGLGLGTLMLAELVSSARARASTAS